MSKAIYEEHLDQTEEQNEYRICSQCNSKMYSGYVIDNGLNYYCSDECLTQNMTLAEYTKLYADGEGDSYWTVFE